MVLTIHIDIWGVSRIHVDNGSQVEILSLSAFKKMGYNKKQLKEPTKPLYGFSGKRIELIGVITLPVLFCTPKNPRTEYITFDVADMVYPYNTIFGRGLLNSFKAPCIQHNNYIRQSKGSKKHRARFHPGAQKSTFLEGRCRSA
jgi:hypothetical protein